MSTMNPAASLAMQSVEGAHAGVLRFLITPTERKRIHGEHHKAGH